MRAKAAPQKAAPKPTMPPALESLLDGMEDRFLAVKLRKVYEGVASAMESLGYLNLVKYEPDSAEEGSADLDMWEKMAKPVADTLAAVNTALHGMRKAFPRAFGGDPRGPDAVTEVGDVKRAEEIESVIRAIVRRLDFTLEEVRKQLRRPDVVSSRWRLLAELQEVRTGFRRQLGDLVFLTTNALANVQREQVVPGHQGEVSHMVELRRASAELARALGEQRQRLVAGATSAEVVATAAEGLATLQGTGAWRYMPAEVKRAVLALRDGLAAAQDHPPEPDALRALLEPCCGKLLDLVASLAEGLDAHDREVWAECSARLSQVELHLALGASGGPRIFCEALEVAENLAGRDARLDGWLRQARKLEAARLKEAELREELAHFKEQLEVLPFH